MTNIALLLGNGFACLGIFMTGFCRVILMDRMTKPDVRTSVIVMMLSALAMAGGPFIPEWRVYLSWPIVILEWAVLVMQLSSGRLWYLGQPEVFRRRRED